MIKSSSTCEWSPSHISWMRREKNDLKERLWHNNMYCVMDLDTSEELRTLDSSYCWIPILYGKSEGRTRREWIEHFFCLIFVAHVHLIIFVLPHTAATLSVCGQHSLYLCIKFIVLGAHTKKKLEYDGSRKFLYSRKTWNSARKKFDIRDTAESFFFYSDENENSHKI